MGINERGKSRASQRVEKVLRDWPGRNKRDLVNAPGPELKKSGL